MPIAFVQAKSAQAGTGTTSITTPSMTSGSGNFVAAGVVDGSRTISGTPLTDSNSNTWTQAWVRGATGASWPCALYSAKNITAGAGHTFTFTPQGGTDSCAIAVAEFSGIDTTAPLDQVASAASAANPHNSGNITTTSPAEQLLIGFASDGNQQTLPPASQPGLFTDVVSLADGSPEGILFSYAIVAAVAPYAYEYTYENGGSDTEASGIATFKGSSIAYVQSKSVQTSGAVSITTPSFVSTSQNCLVAMGMSATRNFTGSPVTDSLTNTWATAFALGGLGCAYALNIVGGGSHTVTLTPVGGSSPCALAVGEFSGIDLTGALDKTKTSTHTAEPRSTGATAPISQPTELLVGVGSVSHLTLLPYSTLNGDWTDVAALRHVISGSIAGILLSYRIITLPGTFSFGFSNGLTSAENVGIATFKTAIPVIPDDGDVPAAVNPVDDDSICGAEVPLFYCELQTDSGFLSYSWIDQPINEPTIQRQPRIVAVSTLRRELSDWNGRLVINTGSITLTDYDGAIRALLAQDTSPRTTIIRKQIDFYFIDAANLPPHGPSPATVPMRVGQYLITSYELGPDMTVQLTFEDRFGGTSLRDLLQKPLPFRTLSTSFNATLPVALIGKGEPITYGVLSDETVGYPSVQVWYTGTHTMTDTSIWYEGLIAGCATSGPITVWGSDGSLTSEGEPRQVKMDPAFYNTDIAMPGHGTVWSGYFGSQIYRVVNSRRYTIMYFRVGSDIGEAFKLFGTTNGSQGVPVHVNLGGIEDVGDSTGAVIDSLARQWQHLITNYVEAEVANANWAAIPLTANTPAYSIIDTASVEATKDRAANARVPGGYLGAFVIGHDLSRLPLGDWFQRLCLGGDMDMGIDRHGRAFLSMEDPTASPIMNFDIYSVLQDTYQPPRKDQSKLFNSVQSNTIKNLFQLNASVTLRPSADQSVGANPMWLTAGHPPDEDTTSIDDLGGDPVGRKEQTFDDWVTRDFTLDIPESVKAHRLARSKDGPDFHSIETDLCGLDMELGQLFTITHYAGLVPTIRTVRCTAIELDPPDPFRKSWAVRLFGYDVTDLTE